MSKFLMFWMMLLMMATQANAGAPSKVIGATTVDTMFAKRLEEMNYTFVDIRSAEDFAKGRVPGAKNLAFGEGFTSAALAAIVKKDDEVIFYGSDSLSDISAQATQKAMDWGWKKVFYFREGYAQWSTVGLEVEK